MKHHMRLELGLPDHAIFHDHRHLHLHVKLTICYPAGAGGHWLAGQINDYHSYIRDVNRYDSRCIWLDLDDDLLIFENGTLRFDFDVEQLAAKMNPPKWMREPQSSIACGHLPPALTHLVTDFITDQLLVIECAPDTAWYVHAIGRCKALLDSSFNQKQWLHRVLPPGQNADDPSEDYTQMISSLQHHVPRVNLWMTPLSWMWYTESKNTRQDASDIDSFRLYATDQLFNALRGDQQGIPHSALAIQNHSWYQATLRYMSAVNKTFVIDYGSYFFDGLATGCALIDNISCDARLSYMRSNIALLRDVATIALTDVQYTVQHECRALSKRLQGIT